MLASNLMYMYVYKQVRGLYKGMSYPLMGQVFINATVFSVHGSCMRVLQPDGGNNNVAKSTLAGFIAGCVQSVICSPMELIKLKMQVQGIGMELNSPIMASVLSKTSQSSYVGPWKTTKHIYRQDGIIRGLMKGFVPTLCREGPSFAVYFGSYDFIRQRIATLFSVPLDQLGIPYLFLSGGLAGCLTWISTYPFDVIKTRIQLDTNNTYSGMFDCFRQSITKDGYRVLFRGISSALYRAFSTNAVTLTTVTIVLQYWDTLAPHQSHPTSR